MYIFYVFTLFSSFISHSLLSFRYDPLQNLWERLADLHKTRCNFTMVVLDRMIYAIGGDIDPETNLDSVERYCPNTDTWR
jgi:kelch-like protein 33